MFRPYTVWLGLRYIRPRRYGYAGFVTVVSALGIALGVAVLMTVMSVMNGFDREIHHKIFSLADQVLLSAPAGLDPSKQLQSALLKIPDVSAISPMVQAQGMLSLKGRSFPIEVRGVEPKKFAKVSPIPKDFVRGDYAHLARTQYGIVIGNQLAQALGAELGDQLTLVSPEATASIVGVAARFKRFKLVGVFHVGGNMGQNAGLAFVNLNAAQHLYRLGDKVTHLRLAVKDLNSAPQVALTIRKQFGKGLQVRDWTQNYANFFHAIALEKTMMFLILSLIVAVAAFNLVSGLVMMVHAKRSEIAILKTLGATRAQVLSIFITQGLSICLLGLALGVGLGLFLIAHANQFVQCLEQLLGQNLISDAIYFVNYLPTELSLHDVLQIVGLTLLFCIVSVLYPAYCASGFQPARVLRHA